MSSTSAIPFHIPYTNGRETAALQAVLREKAFSQPGSFHHQSEEAIRKVQKAASVVLTGSCTHALEAAALLLELKPEDEVILPSFGYPSMANAFVLRGARPVFVDIDPLTMNIDPAGIERAISGRTKAVIVMHYGGVACDLDTITRIADAHRIPLIEDAAHCIGAYFRSRGLGAFGRFGALSFHLTKNIHCGQGGALLTSPEDLDRAQMILEKGTDRRRMLRGEQNTYTWCDLGSSYQLPALSAAFLSVQLPDVEPVNTGRRSGWNRYFRMFRDLGLEDRLGLFDPGAERQHNGHLFFIKCRDAGERAALTQYLLEKNIQAFFHYLPLHASPAGKKYGRFAGKDLHTTRESSRLLRLPLFSGMTSGQQERVCAAVANFLKVR